MLPPHFRASSGRTRAVCCTVFYPNIPFQYHAARASSVLPTFWNSSLNLFSSPHVSILGSLPRWTKISSCRLSISSFGLRYRVSCTLFWTPHLIKIQLMANCADRNPNPYPTHRPSNPRKASPNCRPRRDLETSSRMLVGQKKRGRVVFRAPNGQ